MNFIDLQRNCQYVVDNLNKIVIDSAMQLDTVIADLNTKQLEQGKRADGKNITPKYQSNVYASYKKSIGAKPAKGTPDLKLTGDFHAGIYAFKKGDMIHIDSTDEKSPELQRKYDKIFGLNKESINELKPDLTFELQKKLTDELTKSNR